MSDRPRGTILNSTSRARFMASMRDFAVSPEGPKAKFFFLALITLMVGINSLNVWSSYIGRDFMTAVASRDGGEFTRQTLRFVAILVACTVVAVVFRYVEERLGLIWRHFLTERLVGLYLRRRFYHQLGSSHRIANPDQRIADDVKTFTTMTLSFLLMILNASMSVVAFSGVMWSISPLLFGVAVSYALCGSAITIRLGRPLIWINYNQLDREAEFRADLVQLRENSEFVALAQHETHFDTRLKRRIHELVRNYRKLISINRNLNFFTTGYNTFIQIIPVLVVGPLYIRGQIEFGVITQSAVAFAQLLGAFSLIITQFQSISSFTAVVARLDDFSEAAHDSDDAGPLPIDVVDGDDGLTFDCLTLASADGATLLVEDLSLTVERGQRMMVSGPGEMAKMALFRATADLWDHGHGRIVRPNRRCISFVPERPYLPPGTMREVLVAPNCTQVPSDQRIHDVLERIGLTETLARIGGLEIEKDWDDLLSLGELQRFAVARVLIIAPDFAVLDRIETTLEASCMHDVLSMLDEANITYVTIGRGNGELSHYNLMLELTGTGPWTLTRLGSAEDSPTPRGVSSAAN